MLANIYAMIGDCEMKLNRPVAARTALELAIRCVPSEQELRQSFEQLFGEKSHLPPAHAGTTPFCRYPSPLPPSDVRPGLWQFPIRARSPTSWKPFTS